LQVELERHCPAERLAVQIRSVQPEWQEWSQRLLEEREPMPLDWNR
jgi:hypothetical protein